MDEDPLENVAAASVGELVRRRLSATDRWNLATVQRAEVWNEVRMRHLLDSLLVGYPVGAILLCRTKDASRVTEIEGRRDSDAAEGEWQLLDGQQRINALFSMLTPHGNYGRFYLNMAKERVSPGPAQRSTNKGRSLGHIVHRAVDAEGQFENRDRCIDLARWAEWADAQDDLSRLRSTERSDVGTHLKAVDPEFADSLSEAEQSVARNRFRALIDLWTESRIPVLRAELETPLDVLEVFTRINLGGVNIAGIDVYFAGVKTFWRDAERRLDLLLDSAPFLGSRIGALRFLSRLASRGLGYGDVLPLTVDRLMGPQGESVRAAMKELTSDDAEPLRRVAHFSAWYQNHSSLGYVLKQVTAALWDDVLAWAAASPRSDDDWYAENLEFLDAYLLGATVFGYRSVMGDTFHRLAMQEALDAGSNGEPFPFARIVGVARASTRLLGSRGRAVLGLESSDHRVRLAQLNGWLLIALAQRIPYSWAVEENFDWDHIFPKSQQSRMWAPGQGRRRQHPHRHLINTTGNFWALNYSVNRSLGDTVGAAKFEALRRLVDDPNQKAKVWPVDRWSLTDTEIENFIEVNRLLTNDHESVDRAMDLFKETVTSRSDRLFESALERFPLIRLCAGDESPDLENPVDGHRDYRQTLGLSAGAAALQAVEVDEARRALHRRAKTLSTRLEGLMDSATGVTRAWVWHGRRPSATTSVAFELTSGNCIELVMKWDEYQGVRLQVKAYPTYNKPGSLFPSWDHIDLGVDWTSPEGDIANAFLAHAKRLEIAHPRAVGHTVPSP